MNGPKVLWSSPDAKRSLDPFNGNNALLSMTDTTRELIQRMADELDHYKQLLMDDRRKTHPLANEARAYLAQYHA